MLRYLAFAIAFLLSSCESSPESPDLSADYFPLKVGMYQIYDVDETQYNQLTGNVQSVYQLKVLIADSLANVEGGYTYVLHRQKRNDANSAWENLPTWTARISNRQGIVSEENTSFVKLLFPLGDGVSWNGNAFNSLGGDQVCGDDAGPCDIYQMENVNSPYSPSPDASFDHSVVVVQNDNPDLIVKQDVRKEVYAEGIGLVYRESTVLNYCTKPDCLGKQIIETGVRYRQVIKEYGGL